MEHRRIGALLLEAAALKEEELQQALELQALQGGRLGELLMRLGAVSEDTLYAHLAGQMGCPLVDAGDLDEDALREGLHSLQGPVRSLVERKALAWIEAAEDGAQVMRIAASDILDLELREVLESRLEGRRMAWSLIRPSDLERMQSRLRAGASSSVNAQSLRELAEDAPVIAFVNNLLAQALEARASDVHVEPGASEFDIRLRIDGVLHDRLSLPMARYPAIASRIKLIGQLDIAERRLPQDGRISARVAGSEIDIRISSIPAVHGESLVLRLLPKARGQLDLGTSGMLADHLAMFRAWLQRPDGLVLVTGPTGSGKSTTLYSALSEINDRTRKLVTVEDPVELRLPHVVQIQTQAEIGLTFAAALRSILRHDPDVIMVGEIRDRETAEIAIQSALTGHLVLATLHTNDALSSVTRLVDMGVEPYLVAASLRAVMAQRLVRRLCPVCSAADEPSQELQQRFGAVAVRFPGVAPRPSWRRPVGCPQCSQTGYRGRGGIFELVTVDDELQHAIARSESFGGLVAMADRRGRRSLHDDGLLRVGTGETHYEEVLRGIGGLADE